MWNPSSQKLLNIESDEAGRLKKFRGRFGRGFDSESTVGQDEVVSITLYAGLDFGGFEVNGILTAFRHRITPLSQKTV